MNKIMSTAFGILMAGFSASAFAQQDEIIVTATRIQEDGPGIFLEKKGDFLLLEVGIENDSRDLSTRLSEINETVEFFIEAAEDDPNITLSIIDENDFVRPLSETNFKDGIRNGNRPDTSIAYLKVKTDIPERVQDSYKLAAMLGEFVDNIEETGRTKIQTYDEISVSVVDPYQYRREVTALVVEEINEITAELGPDYRAVIHGLDKELKWARSGDLNLAFYLPYEYFILPTSLNSYAVEIMDD